MRHFIVTPATYALAQAAALHGGPALLERRALFGPTFATIPMGNEAFARLDACRLPAESDDALVRRILKDHLND